MKRILHICLLTFAYRAGAESAVTLSLLSTYEREPEPAAVAAMEEEIGSLFQGSGATVRWQRMGSANFLGETNQVIVVQFRGSCRTEAGIPRPESRSRLASTLRTDGRFQPFIEVDCTQTGAHLRSGMRGGSPAPEAGRVFGRALGRVLAHELFHYLTQAATHRRSPLFGRGIRPTTLAAERAAFDAVEMDWLRVVFRRLTVWKAPADPALGEGR